MLVVLSCAKSYCRSILYFMEEIHKPETAIDYFSGTTENAGWGETPRRNKV